MPVPVRVVTVGELEALLANDAVAEAAPLAAGVNVTVKDTGWLVVTVTGNVRPLIENSAGFVPPRVTEETETVPPPAVRVPVCVPLSPSTTLPTLIGLVTLKVVCVAPTPDPVSGTVKFEFEASDVIVTLPLKLPADGGVNVTLNDVLCPGGTVTGVNPETLNPVPLAVTWEICTFEPPVFFTVSVCVELWPTCTFVNVMLEGFGVSVPGVTPVPVSGMLRLGFEPVDVIFTLPLTVPLALGLKCTVNDVLWPAFNVKGKVSPLKLNPAPLTLAAEMVRLDPPVLVSVSGKLELLPTCTLPNARLVGFGVKVPGVTPVPDKAMSTVVADPLTVSDRLPLLAPTTVGAKLMLKVEA